MRILVLLALLLGVATTSAFAGGHKSERMEKIRKLYAKGDYDGVRIELLAQYEDAPEPALLFALGQVELNLGHYKEAIDYYQRFLETKPADDQVSLAQQAIGAARMRMSEPEPPPPPPPPKVLVITKTVHDEPERPPPATKHWTLTQTGLVAFGGAATLLGAGLLWYAHSLGNDHSGTLSQYDARLDQARTTRWTGAGVGAAGLLLVGVAFAW